MLNSGSINRGAFMSLLETHSNPHSFDPAFVNQLARALRGGLILLAGCILWGLFLPQRNDPFFNLCFMWLPCAWLVFPVGALLGYFLPKWVAGRAWGIALVIGLVLGSIIGLVLAAGFWVVRNHNDLIGLVVNRHSGGYASYSMSVRFQLRDQAWRALIGVAPVTAAWITAWTVWIRYRWRVTIPQQVGQKSSPPVRLGLDARIVRLVGSLAAGLGLFAVLVLLLTALFARGVQVPLSSFFIIGPGAAGLVILGPFLGPMVTGWSFGWALRYAALGLPILLVGLAPFVLCKRPVRPGTAVAAWCGLLTALFFWIATGLFSLGRCLG
jgi:hypothetical protein